MTIAQQTRAVGYAIARQVFSPAEIAIVNDRVAHYLRQSHAGIATETDGRTVRGIHGLHLYDAFFAKLLADARLLDPAEALLNEQCYIHQSKINVKKAVVGARWPWHQDFVFWQKEDCIAEPRLLNVALLLDDVDDDNGPLCLIPRSHTLGDLTDIESQDIDGWQGNVSEYLTYQIGPERLQPLIASNGLAHFTGRAGDVLFFNPMLVHSSPANRSQRNRSILIVTYNAVSNPPLALRTRIRPEFLCARSCEALRSLAGGSYLLEFR